jgi:hypothetical protein
LPIETACRVGVDRRGLAAILGPFQPLEIERPFAADLRDEEVLCCCGVQSTQ